MKSLFMLYLLLICVVNSSISGNVFVGLQSNEIICQNLKRPVPSNFSPVTPKRCCSETVDYVASDASFEAPQTVELPFNEKRGNVSLDESSGSELICSELPDDDNNICIQSPLTCNDSASLVKQPESSCHAASNSSSLSLQQLKNMESNLRQTIAEKEAKLRKLNLVKAHREKVTFMRCCIFSIVSLL